MKGELIALGCLALILIFLAASSVWAIWIKPKTPANYRCINVEQIFTKGEHGGIFTPLYSRAASENVKVCGENLTTEEMPYTIMIWSRINDPEYKAKATLNTGWGRQAYCKTASRDDALCIGIKER